MRILGTDLDGTKKLPYSLMKIRGISRRIANAIVKVAGFTPEMRVGNLTDADVRKLESVIKDPLKHGIPAWLLNQRRDMETGKDLHLTGPDLTLRTRENVTRMIDARSWKGFRRSLGLTVRGQKTRTTGRRGRVVGVKKRARIRQA